MARTRANRRARRLASLRSQVTESDQWRIRILGDSGFAWRTISRIVLGDNSDSGQKLVGRILLRDGIKVTDYRKAENATGSGVVASLNHARRTGSLRARSARAGRMGGSS
jgi:hypothetical protein